MSKRAICPSRGNCSIPPSDDDTSNKPKEGYDMEENVTIALTTELNTNSEWWALFDKAEQIAHKEATKLYRLAWRMREHNCSEEAIRKCGEEARMLWEGVGANPAWFLDWFGAHKFVYAFKF